MRVITQDRLITDLAWWSQMRVEGDSIVLSNVRVAHGKEETPEDELSALSVEEPLTLVVADFPDEQPVVQDLFKDINTGIKHGKDSFNVAFWLDERKSA